MEPETRCWRLGGTHIKHLGIVREGNVVDADGEVEGVGEVDGSLHWIYRTVPNMKQGGCVVESQITKKEIVTQNQNI